jgi:hypothetical protein
MRDTKMMRATGSVRPHKARATTSRFSSLTAKSWKSLGGSMSLKSINRRIAWILFAGMLLFGKAAYSQANTGTIYGTITDTAGAAIPDAAIVITNTGTNVQNFMRTNSLGEFKAIALPTGQYSVRVDKDGFTSFIQQNINLNADSTSQASAVLKVKSTTEAVTVNGEASLIQAESTNLVQVVGTKQVQDLPLNGRNVLSLVGLDAGVSLDGTNSSGVLNQVNVFNSVQNESYSIIASINGSRGNQTNYLLDNGDNNEGFNNLADPFPNPDAVQEFSLQTSTFDAEYGRGVGGVVNVITKSGTNTLHGSMYDYLRNFAMNAPDFYTGLDTLRRNQFGASLGGPLVIPHLYNGKDKTFFFGSYQGTRQSIASPNTIQYNAPSAAMFQGDVSAFLEPDGTGTVYDPQTGEPFPGNIIPKSRWNPVSQNILAYIPQANAPNSEYIYATPSNTTQDDQFLIRVDENINSKQRVFGRYFLLDENDGWGSIPHNIYYIGAGQKGIAQSLSLDHTWTISPTLLNDLNFMFHRESPNATPPPASANSFTSWGAPGILTPGIPGFILGINYIDGFMWNYIGYNAPGTDEAVADSVSFSKGKHSFRFGGEIKKNKYSLVSSYLSGGNAQFNGGLTGPAGKTNKANAWAEFLLGDLSSWQQQSEWSEGLNSWFYNLYAQDDIRLTPKLTINAGIRWEPRLGITEDTNKQVGFKPGYQSLQYKNSPLGVVFAGDPIVGNHINPNRWANFAPRFGVAYQLMPDTVIRSAFGMFYDQPVMESNNRSASAAPFVAEALCAPCAGSLSAPLGPGVPPLNPVPGAVPRATVAFPAYTGYLDTQDLSWKAPYSESWNLVLEHQFGSARLLRSAYVGSAAHHLNNDTDVNLPIYIPGECGSQPCSTVANENQRRPYQSVGQMGIDATEGNSRYSALQVTFQQRASHGINFQSNYTWSKSEDTQSTKVQICATIQQCWGVSDFDVNQRFIFSGDYRIPEVKNWNVLAREVLGGWQANLIFNAQTGTPFSVFCPDDNSLSGITETGTTGDFCDLTGAPLQPSESTRTYRNWANAAAFKPNAVGTFGTENRNQLRNPGWWNLDSSLFKEFQIKERFTLQLRGEAFNVFNHQTFNTGSAANYYSVQPSSPTFAQNFAQLYTDRPPRILQVAAKIIF